MKLPQQRTGFARTSEDQMSRTQTAATLLAGRAAISVPFDTPSPRFLRRDAARHPVVIGAMLLAGAFGLAGALGTVMALAHSQCRADPLAIAFGAETHVRMTVRGGSACAVAARTVPAPISALRVVDQPRNGAVSPRGRTGVIYRPARGFKGEDAFSFALRGTAQQSGLSVVRVRVTVQ